MRLFFIIIGFGFVGLGAGIGYDGVLDLMAESDARDVDALVIWTDRLCPRNNSSITIKLKNKDYRLQIPSTVCASGKYQVGQQHAFRYSPKYDIVLGANGPPYINLLIGLIGSIFFMYVCYKIWKDEPPTKPIRVRRKNQKNN